MEGFKSGFHNEVGKFSASETSRRGEQTKDNKAETVYFNYIFDELLGRLGNLELLLEIHEKMQEIVQQAARKEVAHREKELDYEERLRKATKQLDKIRNAEGYLRQIETVKANR